MNVVRLGWTLVHFLWQGALIGALYAAIRSLVKRSERRYALACAALVAMMAAPVITWFALAPLTTTVVQADRTAIVPGKIVPATTQVGEGAGRSVAPGGWSIRDPGGEAWWCR